MIYNPFYFCQLIEFIIDLYAKWFHSILVHNYSNFLKKLTEFSLNSKLIAVPIPSNVSVDKKIKCVHFCICGSIHGKIMNTKLFRSEGNFWNVYKKSEKKIQIDASHLDYARIIIAHITTLRISTKRPIFTSILTKT